MTLNTDCSSTAPVESNILQQRIMSVLESEIKRIVDEEAKVAADRTEKRVRQLTGMIAAELAANVAFQNFGRELRISVTFPSK